MLLHIAEGVPFQSTLPRGERLSHRHVGRSSGNFNPRSHEGSDLTKTNAMGTPFCISIHAPTRGATSRQEQGGGTDTFQSTLPRGERPPDAYTKLTDPSAFQSTLPRGERRGRQTLRGGRMIYFNPRSHEGSDPMSPKMSPKCRHFNPRSHEGSDSCTSRSPCTGSHFNPRSHEGSDIGRLLFS